MCKKIKCIVVAIFIMFINCSYLYAADAVLKWDAASGDVSGYKIYYGLSIGDYSLSEDVGNVTQYALSNFQLAEGTTYYFVVRAYNSAGESADSNVATYTVPSAGDTTPPIAPQSVSASIVNQDILVQWQANSEVDISGYRLYYGTSSRDYGLPISVSGTEYTLSGLATDTTYYIAVLAVDTSGNESGYSTEISAIIPGTVEGPLLKWDVSTGEVTGYRVYYSTAEGQYTQNVDVGNVTQYALSNLSLSEGVTYYFVVRAYNSAGESGDSNVATFVVGETADTTAPSISITSPTTQGSYSAQSSSIDMSGTASDDVGITTVTWSNSRGGSGTASGTTSWSVSNVFLAEGDNLISVTVTDTTGNTSTDVLTVTYTIPDTVPTPDTTAPQITVTSPTWGDNYPVETNTITVGGTASDDIGLSQVVWSNSQGGSGTAAGTTNWSAEVVSLVEGPNEIVFTATDQAGNTATDSLTVWYEIPDTTAPTVSIVTPTTGGSYDTGVSNLGISGTASDNIGVSSVTWSNSRGGSGQATGTSSWSIAGISLAEGENIITITASDEADNSFSSALTVVYTVPDTTAPAVSIVTPTTGGSYDTGVSNLDISGTASDNIGVSSVNWSNSRGGSGQATGTANWSIAGISLAEGENIITITAVDVAQNSSTDALTVVYTVPDTTAPVVSIVTPTTGGTYDTETSSLDISGTASDNIGVSSVNWSNSRGGSGQATGTSSWSIAGISLAEGENIITITAVDGAQNSSTDTLTVVYTEPVTTPPPIEDDTEAPVIELIEPDTGGKFYFTREPSIRLSGTASDNVGVKEIRWAIAQGGSGIANVVAGVPEWEATSVPLNKWWNNIEIIAEDEAGNKTVVTLTVFSWKK